MIDSKRALAILDQTALLMICLDLQGRIIEVNPAACRVLGYEKEDLLGLEISDISPDFPASTWARTLAELEERGRFVMEALYLCSSRKTYPVTIFFERFATEEGVFVCLSARTQQEQKQRQYEQELDTIFDVIPLMIFVKEAGHLRYTRMNSAGEALTGCSRETLFGKSDYDFFPTAMADYFTSKDREVLGSGEMLDIPEETIETPQGQRVLHTRKMAVRDAKGRPKYLVGISEDITERQEADAWLHLLGHALDEIEEAVFMLDDNARFVYVNQGAVRHLGYTKDELLAMGLGDIDQKFSLKQWSEFWRRLKQEGCHRFETVQQRKDSSLFSVEIVINFIRYRDREVNLGLARDISERKRVERELTASSQRYRSVLETTKEGFWMVDPQGCLLEVNDAYCEMSGYSRQELLTMQVFEVEAKELSEETAAHLERIKQQGSELFETLHRRKEGEIFPVEISVSFVSIEGGRFFSLIRDITERKQAEQLAQLRQDLAEGIYKSDRTMLLQAALGTAVHLTGSRIGFFYLPGQEHESSEVEVLFPEIFETSGFAREAVQAWIRGEESACAECRIRRRPIIRNISDAMPLPDVRRQNEPAVFRELCLPLLRDDRIVAVIGIGGKQRDYTPQDADAVRQAGEVAFDYYKRREAESQVEYLAFHDALTGLPNRELLTDRMNQAIAQCRRSHQILGLCYLDLDGFKPINDKYGHHIGDALLIGLSERLKSGLREGDTLARLGGDEFVVMLTGLASPDECREVVQRILETVGRPIEVEGYHLHVSGSIGVTVYPNDDSNPDILLRHADQAMYQAKEMGKSQYRFYDPAHDLNLRTHRQIREEFAVALQNNQLILHYQPKIDLRSGRVVGMEALVRWQHPEQGLLYPGKFLPLIENTPLEVALGEWVVNNALKQQQQWRSLGIEFSVSVNISPRHIQMEAFAQFLADLLADYPPQIAQSLELEILERSAIGDTAQVASVMNACARLGVRFSLDDFGTGYSSLTYFYRLPIDALKIDQNFVREMLDHSNDLDIVEGVLRLSETLGRPVIAEGVESAEIGLMLLYLGCRYAQGYGIARPMPADKIAGWLERWEGNSLWHCLQNETTGGTESYDLNVAIFSHKSWLAQVLAYLCAESPVAEPVLDESQCQFGRWYRGIGRARYGGRPDYPLIQEQHRRVHELARILAVHAKEGERERVLSGIDEFVVLGEDLIDGLRRLSNRP